jgi:hypothetical protein
MTNAFGWAAAADAAITTNPTATDASVRNEAK